MAIRQRRAPADTVLLNGTILTVDKAFSRAKAVAMSGGRFVAVGKNAEVKKLIGPDTRVLDLAGRTVVPGFIDTHGHMAWRPWPFPWSAPGRFLRYSNL